MTNSTPDATTLVLGGTGKTGRRVAKRLTARNLPVQTGSRSGQCGTMRLVLLSWRGESGARRNEDVVREAGADATIVRSSFFAQNFSEDFLADAMRAGVLAFPAGDVAEPFIDAEDIADVAVAALTEDGHAGRLYEVTGPRLLSFADAVAEIADASGREITYLPVTPQEYEIGMVSLGLREKNAALLTGLFAEVLDGRNAQLSDGVQRALGRQPRDFTDFAPRRSGGRRLEVLTADGTHEARRAYAGRTPTGGMTMYVTDHLARAAHDPDPALRELVDRHELVDALHRFGPAQDLRDRTLFCSALAADAELDFHPAAANCGIDSALMSGRDTIVATILGMPPTPPRL